LSCFAHSLQLSIWDFDAVPKIYLVINELLMDLFYYAKNIQMFTTVYYHGYVPFELYNK
jgi:hypothetical protein